MTDNVWQPVEMETIYGDYLLRVRRTESPHRVHWFVVPIAEVKKSPRWFGSTPGKGASHALAKGYSLTFDKAQQDAVAMAKAIEEHGVTKVPS